MSFYESMDACAVGALFRNDPTIFIVKDRACELAGARLDPHASMENVRFSQGRGHRFEACQVRMVRRAGSGGVVAVGEALISRDD